MIEPVDRVLVLASGSPRRAEILGSAGIDVVVVPADLDEDEVFDGASNLVDAVQQLATTKAKAVAGLRSGEWVLGADTIVVMDDEVLGKPESVVDAEEMLGRLSGRSHEVITGVAVIGPDGDVQTNSTVTSVRFRELGRDEISSYVATGSPLDKAGGYGIQDSSFAPVARYDGCYLNVVGLPMCATRRLLEISGFMQSGVTVCEGHAGMSDSECTDQKVVR